GNAGICKETCSGSGFVRFSFVLFVLADSHLAREADHVPRPVTDVRGRSALNFVIPRNAERTICLDGVQLVQDEDYGSPPRPSWYAIPERRPILAVEVSIFDAGIVFRSHGRRVNFVFVLATKASP